MCPVCHGSYSHRYTHHLRQLACSEQALHSARRGWHTSAHPEGRSMRHVSMGYYTCGTEREATDCGVQGHRHGRALPATLHGARTTTHYPSLAAPPQCLRRSKGQHAATSHAPAEGHDNPRTHTTHVEPSISMARTMASSQSDMQSPIPHTAQSADLIGVRAETHGAATCFRSLRAPATSL